MPRRARRPKAGGVAVAWNDGNAAVSEERDEGMEFPPLAPVDGDASQWRESGWGEPHASGTWDGPSAGQFSIETEPELPVVWMGTAIAVEGGSSQARVATIDAGETRSTWGSTSGTNQSGDWMTPDWSQTSSAKRPAPTATDERRYITYDGDPVFVESRKEVDEWCDHIRASGVRVLGFDTEWRPERVRGQNNTIALVQICFRDVELGGDFRVVLFHTIRTGMTEKLKDLIEDETVIKAGVDFTCDRRKLDFHFGVVLRGDVDLGCFGQRNCGGTRFGMKSLVKVVLGLEMRKPKSVQTVNWEGQLGYKAIQYAALDAYVCSRLYEEIFKEGRDCTE